MSHVNFAPRFVAKSQPLYHSYFEWQASLVSETFPNQNNGLFYCHYSSTFLWRYSPVSCYCEMCNMLHTAVFVVSSITHTNDIAPHSTLQSSALFVVVILLQLISPHSQLAPFYLSTSANIPNPSTHLFKCLIIIYYQINKGSELKMRSFHS